MKRANMVAAWGLVLSLGVLVEPAVAICPPDSVQSGPVCLDKYESSVWDLSAVPTVRMRNRLVGLIRGGRVSLANLTGAGAVQRGLAAGDLAANGCPASGNGCVDVYAVSLPGVTPSAFVTWFQAAAAARNSGKRLPTNQEWQAAALGTPDPGIDDGSTTCATATSLSATGSRGDCVSDVGAFDMVGNLHEWVADWVPRSPDCSNDWGAFSDDTQCLYGAAPSGSPGALIRGGSFYDGAWGGVFFVSGNLGPEAGFDSVGFRCAR